MKTAIAVIATLVLSGCQTYFVHDTKTEADFYKDQYECESIAKQRTADSGYAGNVFIEAGEMKKCLVNKFGWREGQKPKE